MIDGVVQRCSVKKVSLEISQNSQENTCARVFGTGIFQWTLWNSTNIFSMEHLWWLLLYWSPPYHLLLVITLVLIKKIDNDYVMKHLFISSLIFGVIYISLVVTPRSFLCIGDRKSFEQCLTKWTMTVNDTHIEKLFYSFQFKNLLKQKLGCFWLFSYAYTINWFLHILLSQLKEQICFKNVIHPIDRNEWLLVLGFQQGLRQSLSWC